jgi:hypothetical protein
MIALTCCGLVTVFFTLPSSPNDKGLDTCHGERYLPSVQQAYQSYAGGVGRKWAFYLIIAITAA